MTKDIETVILPKCSRCKTVIEHPHEGYIVVGDIEGEVHILRPRRIFQQHLPIESDA